MRAMLLGIWKSVEELEETVSLPELTGLLKVHAEREFADRKFMAALKGVELPDPSQPETSTFEEVQKRAAARLAGKSVEEIGRAHV